MLAIAGNFAYTTAITFSCNDLANFTLTLTLGSLDSLFPAAVNGSSFLFESFLCISPPHFQLVSLVGKCPLLYLLLTLVSDFGLSVTSCCNDPNYLL